MYACVYWGFLGGLVGIFYCFIFGNFRGYVLPVGFDHDLFIFKANNWVALTVLISLGHTRWEEGGN